MEPAAFTDRATLNMAAQPLEVFSADMKDCQIWMVAAFIIDTLPPATEAIVRNREHRQQTSLLCGKSIQGISLNLDDSLVCGVRKPDVGSLVSHKASSAQYCRSMKWPQINMCGTGFFLLNELSNWKS